MLKSFRYSGSKNHFVGAFLEYEQQIDIGFTVYVEPFIGSGAVFCNNSTDNKSYIINDLNK